MQSLHRRSARPHPAALFALAALAAAISCARKSPPRVPAAPRPGDVDTGIASWYGHPYHGRRTASGEIYDMNRLTAAHRTLPFGTRVRVTNLRNSRSVEVRITDRGPFVKDRIIDLSREAAARIAMLGPGTAPVRLQIVHVPSDGDDASGRYGVQVGAFIHRERAEKLGRELAGLFPPIRLIPRDGDPVLWRLIVGGSLSLEEAHHLAARVRARTGEALVVRVDD